MAIKQANNKTAITDTINQFDNPSTECHTLLVSSYNNSSTLHHFHDITTFTVYTVHDCLWPQELSVSWHYKPFSLSCLRYVYTWTAEVVQFPTLPVSCT